MHDEIPRRVQTRRGFSIIYKNKSLLSSIDPVGRADKTAESVQILPQTLYVVLSPLFGYGLKRLIKRIPESSAVLCIECDAQLDQLFKTQRDSSVKDINVPYIYTFSGQQLCSYVRTVWGPRRFRRIREVCFGAGHSLHESTYQNLVKELQKDISTDWFNAMTLTRLGRLFALNTVKNLSLLHTHKDLPDLYLEETPVLVCGAGPSLDMCIKKLIAAYPAVQDIHTRKLAIFCVDTALPALRAWGIQADLVIALESQHWNLGDFIGFSSSPSPLAMDLSAHSGTARIDNGKQLYLFFTRWTSLSLLDRIQSLCPSLSELKALGSVGLSAVNLALGATRAPVYTCGLDFAYEVDRYHARESPGNIYRLYKSNRLKSPIDPAPAFRPITQKTAGKNGLLLRSDPALRSYQALFEREFAACNRLFDISPYGLPLGIPVKSITEAVESLAGCKKQTVKQAKQNSLQGPSRQKVLDFICSERNQALQLRSILSGKERIDRTQFEQILDNCDYLWAHFPECAAAEGRRPDSDNIAFLKRVRAELDPFIKAFDIAMQDAREN